MKPYKFDELTHIAIYGKIDPERVLATYADPENWRKGIDENTKGCIWIWKGPTICAYELARWGLSET